MFVQGTVTPEPARRLPASSWPVRRRSGTGHEGDILRFVFLHSLILAALVGVLVILQAYVFPFTALVVR